MMGSLLKSVRAAAPLSLTLSSRGGAPVLQELGDLPVDYQAPLRGPHPLVVDGA